MKIVINWRIVNPPDGSPDRERSVVFEETVDGVRESVRSMPYRAWESFMEKRPLAEFVFVGTLKEIPPVLEATKAPKGSRKRAQ